MVEENIHHPTIDLLQACACFLLTRTVSGITKRMHEILDTNCLVLENSRRSPEELSQISLQSEAPEREADPGAATEPMRVSKWVFSS